MGAERACSHLRPIGPASVAGDAGALIMSVARLRGQEYFLERSICRSLLTGG